MRTIAGSLMILFAVTATASDPPPNLPAPSPRPSLAPPARPRTTTDDDAQARRDRVRTLIAEGRSAAPQAVALLESSDAGNRAAAIYVLASLHATESALKVAEAMATDPADNVRLQAAEALGTLGSSDAVAALVRAAASDANRDVRVRAITSLGRIDSPKVIGPIREHLMAPASDAEFQAAAVAAGRQRIAAVEPELIAACNDPQRGDHARSAAAIGLGLMRSAGTYATLRRLTRDSSAVVRFNAVNAIEESGDTAAVDDLLRLFTSAAEEKYVRTRAASALAHLGTTPCLEALRAMAQGPDEFMALHSIVALQDVDALQARALAGRLRERALDPFVIQVADRIVSERPLPWGRR
jgi:HEAT repeat protein